MRPFLCPILFCLILFFLGGKERLYQAAVEDNSAANNPAQSVAAQGCDFFAQGESCIAANHIDGGVGKNAAANKNYRRKGGHQSANPIGP